MTGATSTAIVGALMIIAAVVGYLFLTSSSSTKMTSGISTPSSSLSRPLVTTSPITSASTSTGCPKEKKSTGFIVLVLADSNGTPMQGVDVQAAPATSCDGTETVTAIMTDYKTNSSGLVNFGTFWGDYYKVTVSYSGQAYNYKAPIAANQTILLTIRLPSGNFSLSSYRGQTTTIETSAGSNTTDTFLTNCAVSGVGGFELLVVSEPTSAPVRGEKISAIDTLGCQMMGQSAEMQVVHIDNFTSGAGGWLIPVFPAEATQGGSLNFTVIYQGNSYNFTAQIPPIGTACVTLHVPSGNVTTTAMNGSGSYCS